MRVASIVCNAIAICWTAMYIYVAFSEMNPEDFSNDDFVHLCASDDDTPLSPEEQDEWRSSCLASMKLSFHLEMASSYAGLLCLVMAIVGNVKYQWKLVAPLLVLRALAFVPAFLLDDANHFYLLFLSYPNWRFVSEARKGILTRPATSSGGHQSLPTEDNVSHAGAQLPVGNTCCNIRTVSIVCNSIALLSATIYVVSNMLLWEEYSDYYNVYFCGSDDDDAPMSQEEQDECVSTVAIINFTFYFGMTFSYAGLLCLVMAIVGNIKYQWKLVLPLLILRVLAFSIWFDPLWKFMSDGSNLFFLLLSLPNWKFVWEVREGILTCPASSSGHQSLPTEDNCSHAVV